MTEYLEFEGKNVDQALEKAAKEMNRDPQSLHYDVVSYGSTGIFGLVGVKKAKIRVKQNGSSPTGMAPSEARQHARDLVKDVLGIEEEEKPSIAPKSPPVVEAPVELDEQTEKAIEVGMQALLRITAEISEGAEITSEFKNNRILYKVDGGNSALLIGKRGQTLEAIQYVVEKIVNKQNGTRLRILVDVEGYLNTRKSNLKRLATKMADKAKRINKPVTIGQMNAYDRRIVHMHLKDNQAVRTQSMGEGYYRKLVIFPKRRKRPKNQKQD